MHCPRFHPVFFLLVSLLAGQGRLPAEERVSPAAPGGNAPGMKGVVYGFFDDKTGARIGRLEIESVGVEYQRRGFLRVAWDPIVVLEGVTLDISAGATWPGAGVKIVDALRVTGRSGASVLRRVRLRIPGSPTPEITAATASLRTDGGLVLRDVTAVASGGSAVEFAKGDLCFWLAGARAGQLVAIAAPEAAVAQTFSAKQTLAPPAP